MKNKRFGNFNFSEKNGVFLFGEFNLTMKYH